MIHKEKISGKKWPNEETEHTGEDTWGPARGHVRLQLCLHSRYLGSCNCLPNLHGFVQTAENSRVCAVNPTEKSVSYSLALFKSLHRPQKAHEYVQLILPKTLSPIHFHYSNPCTECNFVRHNLPYGCHHEELHASRFQNPGNTCGNQWIIIANESVDWDVESWMNRLFIHASQRRVGVSVLESAALTTPNIFKSPIDNFKSN